jgi:hypothetical protein
MTGEEDYYKTDADGRYVAVSEILTPGSPGFRIYDESGKDRSGWGISFKSH